MGAVLKLAVDLISVDCGVCSGTYAINARHHQWCQENGKSWHCPYCNTGWGYEGRGENARLKKELEQERACKQAALERANVSEQNLAQALRARRRLDKRLAAGVCPCCSRTFKQLAAHMTRKHPDYEEKK